MFSLSFIINLLSSIRSNQSHTDMFQYLPSSNKNHSSLTYCFAALLWLYFYLCIFRAKFEEVTVFCSFYFLPSLLPWTYSYEAFTPSTPSKPCSLWSPATSTLFSPKACLNPYELNHWAQFTKPSYLPRYLLSASVSYFGFLTIFSVFSFLLSSQDQSFPPSALMIFWAK